jgi:hypothetical protein
MTLGLFVAWDIVSFGATLLKSDDFHPVILILYQVLNLDWGRRS